MGTDQLPSFIRTHYEVREWRHACTVLAEDFTEEWNDILSVLEKFRLRKSWILNRGGRKSEIAEFIDTYLYEKDWVEKEFSTKIVVDATTTAIPTHKVDCFRNRVALEVEWNNKDTFYDRDLSNFRLLFDLRVISVGVIITRCDELQDIFKKLNKGSSYGASTTHMSKLIPRVDGGGAGGCPILALGISKQLYAENE